MTETLTDAQLLRAAAEKLRQGVAHCAPEAHDYHAPNGRGIAVLRPELATALAELLDTAASHEPERSAPDKEPYGCVKCGGSDGAGACDTWLDGLAVARVIVGDEQTPVHCTVAQPCEQAGPKEPADSLAGQVQVPSSLGAERPDPEPIAVNWTRVAESCLALVRAYEERHTSATVLGSLASVLLRDLAPLVRPAPADRPEAPSREDGASLIAAERRRQVESEHWTPEHDDQHTIGQLAMAASCYALPEPYRRLLNREWGRPTRCAPDHWPDEGWRWKPRPDDRVRELVKAGGLIAAEIDRLLRIRDEGGRE